MIEIRMHGRGGQGGVIAAKILASAIFKEGRFAQSFPSFGVERRGAPVLAFTRVDDKPVRLRTAIYEPDHLIVLDATLIKSTNVFSGLKHGGTILVNTSVPVELARFPEEYTVGVVDAADIAVRHNLGTKSIPIVNTSILGAFSRFTGVVGIDAVVEAIREGVPIMPDENAAAAMEAYEAVKSTALERVSGKVKVN
ncbi:MAG: 2-oxoacid:acceptor oxidoreductase family protein [Bacteroidetes bacterium]|jgi:pyruvate ferredoxin oxidoreductase gamma subunit/2-oxoisovalerate ferredoxin oxidoreductase gamma subunit|nr:2-oxoacid:acceptor oxidoreductase family protein [Bacteroidota bacterium]